MNALLNISKNQITQDVFMSYLELYKNIGKNDYYNDLYSQDLKQFLNHEKELEAYFFYNIYFSDRKISDTRMRLLLTRDSMPKTKDEILFCNIRDVFSQIFDSLGSFETNANEIIDLLNVLGKDVYPSSDLDFYINKTNKMTKIEITKLKQEKKIFLEKTLEKYNELVKKNEYEISFLIVNLYVDFINSEFFNELSEPLFMIVLYVLLLQNGLDCYKYVSFFEQIVTNKKEIDNALLQAKFNYNDGFPMVVPLNRIFIKMFIKAYHKLNDNTRNYLYDQGQRKGDYIENTINKLGDIFTKDEIRNSHPLISDSTIQRTLTKMRDQGLIRPLGTGRSSKWIKLYQTEKKLDFTSSNINVKLVDK